MASAVWVTAAGISGCNDPIGHHWPPSTIAAGGSVSTSSQGRGGATGPGSNLGGFVQQSSVAPGGSAGAPALPGAAVFADDQVVEYRVTIDPAVWAELEEHGDAEEFVQAEVSLSGSKVGEQVLGSVGIRHKGAWTLHHCWDEFGGVRSYEAECAKLSYKLKFNEYNPDTRYEGLKQLNLHAASGDATKLHEMLAYSTFRDFGIDTSRTAPARLYINGQFQGLFIAVEEIDGRYAKTHYPEGGNGNLYKEVWPRTGLPDQIFIDALKTNESNPDVADMQGFAAAIAASTDQTFREDMLAWTDVDALLRYIAVDRAIKNWDGIMAFYSPLAPHNFYWYHDDGAEKRFHLIPWDMDNTFWEFDPFMAPEQWVTADPVPDWNVLPASCEPMSVWEIDGGTRVTPPGCDPFLRMLASTQWDRFVSIGHELLAGPFQYTALLAKANHWASVLEPIIAEDPYVDLVAWRREKEWFSAALQRAVVDFEAFLQKGYTKQEPLPALPEPTQSELDAPMPESGIVLGRVNNYEFTGGSTNNPPAGIFWYGASGTSGTPTWNVTAPLSGTADLRFDFGLTRIPGAWDEWIDLALPTEGSQERDISGYSQISITLKADRTRTVRVRASSPAYDDVFGGAWKEFGTEVSVSTDPKTIKMRLSRMYYPSWAKDDWAGTTKGWTIPDSEALLTVLKRFDGLLIQPQATTGSDGELLGETESGFIQVDNIYFQ
ncbi:MAG: CotH kinase family protein [Myxococcales bacterium]